MNKYISWTVALALAATFSVGCGATRKSALTDAPAGIEAAKTGDASGHFIKAKEAWAKRGDKAQLEAAIGHWKDALTADPANYEAAHSMSRAYYFLADGHVRFEIADEDARKAKMGEIFGEGQYWGERALLMKYPKFREAREADKPLEESIGLLDESAIPAVYWWATNLGKWAAAEGFITLLAHKDQVFAMMDFCIKKNEEFFYGAPHRYFGAYYTKIPLPSGDKAKSRKHFDTAIAKYPNYLATRVLVAEYHAVKFQDRKLFEEQLKYALDTPSNVIAELVPEHEAEKKKAKALLAQADDLFE